MRKRVISTVYHQFSGDRIFFFHCLFIYNLLFFFSEIYLDFNVLFEKIEMIKNFNQSYEK